MQVLLCRLLQTLLSLSVNVSALLCLVWRSPLGNCFTTTFLAVTMLTWPGLKLGRSAGCPALIQARMQVARLTWITQHTRISTIMTSLAVLQACWCFRGLETSHTFCFRSTRKHFAFPMALHCFKLLVKKCTATRPNLFHAGWTLPECPLCFICTLALLRVTTAGRVPRPSLVIV